MTGLYFSLVSFYCWLAKLSKIRGQDILCRFGKCVLNRFMALLCLESYSREETIISKMNLSPAENYTLDLVFTKSPTWCWRAGRWGFSPLRWCCEKFHVSFSNWRLFYDLSKFAVLQQVVKSRFSKCQDCVGYLAFSALILYITRKIMFFNIPLGL